MSEPDRPAPPPPGPDAWDRGVTWLGAHGALPALGVLTIAMCVIYGGIFRGEVAGDDLTFHMAESRRIADCIANGDWDFWNPSANAGYASAYYYQLIPQLASALPAALFGHHTFWFQLSVFLPLVLAPAAAYRGMRLMGAVPWQALTAAFVLSFTIGQSRWGFSADGTFSVGLYTQTWALAAFPLALGHGVRWLRESKGLAPAIVWGAFVGLCHPFGGVSLGLSLALGVTGGVLVKRATWRSPILTFLVTVILGALVAAGWYVLGRTTLLYAGIVIGALVIGAGVRILMTFQAGTHDASWRAELGNVFGEPVRLVALGVGLGVATLPGWITMLVDAKGFGGFPHRVDDEVGPGFLQLGEWFYKGLLLDFGRVIVLTCALPITLLLGRAKPLRWLWIPGFAFALLLGVGPHMPKTADDLIPAVRFLGAMQIMFALGIGTAGYAMALTIWNAPEDHLILRSIRAALRLTGPWVEKHPLQYGVRTGVAAVAAALAMSIAAPGARVEADRVHVLADQPNSVRPQMMTIIDALEHAPPGRKQVGPGCENHWWNLLSYVYGRIPSLLQMGGGGLQASPNYDYLWSVRDFPKNAWVYDAPYLLFEKSKESTMPIGDLVIETEGYIVRSLPTPGLVSPIQITGVLPDGPTGARSEARKASLAWLRTDMPFKDRHLVYAGYGQPGPAPQGKTLRSWRQDSPGDEADLNARIETTGPTTFMARESWHPRWHAYLDGAEVPIRRVTPDFLAVDVAATGAHLLQFRFERPWWAHASWLAWPGVALAAWLGLRLWNRRRERQRIPEARVTSA